MRSKLFVSKLIYFRLKIVFLKMERKTYEYILFDADSTLYDDEICEKTAMQKTWAQYNIPLNEYTKSVYDKHNAVVWDRLEKGEIDYDELQTTRLEKTFSELNFKVDIQQFANDYIHTFAESCVLYPKSLPVLNELKSRGYHLNIITNGFSLIQKVRFNKEGIKGIFENIFCSQDIGVNKPKKEFFDFVFTKLNFSEDQRRKTLIVGDSLSSDIKGGLNSGIDTVWFNEKNLPENPNIQPTYIIHDIEHLLNLLPKL
ncbi:putative HAD-hydrolase YfnB [Tritrichomonas foetus]|uniref:HAD-hydrolase YfnB n=1 Tax=Tritrichomonas foetus TaxID=1144522 RepID=A0A1J4JPY7_9EUKA|nr:putative HAD-hydrolase YfnB [Tritrichomonas foetus]|eukprot:OHT01223.1 putative HAD-hydrolase YfnB [Tritrichomonas foetus]